MVGPKTEDLKFLLGHVRTLRREVHGSKKGALFHSPNHTSPQSICGFSFRLSKFDI